MLTIKVTHLISGLANGGAETSLYNLIKYQSDKENIEYTVVSLGLFHYYEDKLRNLGCRLVDVDILHHPLKGICTVRREMKAADTVCSWMYYSNLLSYYIARSSSVSGLIWFVRHADLSKTNNSRKTLVANRICARKSKSRLIKKIVYNGDVARKIHEEAGYDKTKSLSVYNGCDLSIYKFDPDSRKKVFSQLGIDEKSKVLLSVARDSKIKDVPLFVSSLAQLKKEHRDLVGVMCGMGIDENNAGLTAVIKEKGLSLGKDIFLLGRRDNLPELFSACDVYVLHSAGEAVPNTLIQAMACECLCVATDVGDVRYIISDGAIVPPRNVETMVKKINSVLSLSEDEKAKLRRQNGETARKKFDIKNVVLTYEAIFSED